MSPPAGGERRVSIVIPAYNRAGRLLERAVESVLAQDHPDLELIAIDDGSTDSTSEQLAGYAAADPRLRAVRQDNAGQAVTLNRGFELATGAFLGYLSSDDVLLPGAVEKLIAMLDARPEAVVAYPAYRVIDEDDEVLDLFTPIEYSWVESVRLQDTIVGPGALFRADAYRAVGPLRTDLRYLIDMEFWLRMGRRGPFARTPEPLAAWRRHDDSTTVADAGREMADERLRILDELFESDAAGELAAIRDEAYRNALILAAAVLRPGLNTRGERYAITDFHARTISERAGREDSEERLATMRDRLAAQEERSIKLQRERDYLRDRSLRQDLRDRMHARKERLRGSDRESGDR